MANETIADIIAEMRQGMNPNGTAECQYLESDICMLADRLEAAYKRELSKIRPKNRGDFGQLGDAAKLREACVACVKRIDDTLPQTDSAIVLTGLANHIKETLQNALSTPPRNCDRPECATTKAAADVWRKENGGKTAYHVWLLAPAKEQEGGNDADK